MSYGQEMVPQYYCMDGDSTTNQRRCNHSRWPEANVRQQYRKGLDHLLRLDDVSSTDNNQPWKLKPAVGCRTGSILAFQYLRFNQCRHLVAANKVRTSSVEEGTVYTFLHTV